MSTAEKEKQNRLEGNKMGGMGPTIFRDHRQGLLQSWLISDPPSLIPSLKCIPPAPRCAPLALPVTALSLLPCLRYEYICLFIEL